MNPVVVSNVNKKIGSDLILSDVSLTCEEGTSIALVGRNGSGKSMLLKSICGFVRISSGEIKVFGKRVGVKGNFAPNTSCLIERPGFLRQYSGYQNLCFLASINKGPNSKHIKKVMQDFALDPDDKKRYGKYSLGMRQKLGLAQAFMDDSKLVILDEPTNNLDRETIKLLHKYVILKKKEGITFVIATHDISDIVEMCDRSYTICNGVLEENKL